MLKKKDAIVKANKTLKYMRCFEECIDSFENGKKLPLALCYHRSKVYYKLDEHQRGTIESAVAAATAAANGSYIYLFDEPISNAREYFERTSNHLVQHGLASNIQSANTGLVYSLEQNTISYVISNSNTVINELGRWIQVIKIRVSFALIQPLGNV
jgi:hypothetical protein